MILDIHDMHFKEINIKNRVYNYYFDYLIKAKKIRNKKDLIDEKNYNNLVIYFARYDRGKLIRTLSTYHHELMRNIEKHEGKKCFMIDNKIFDKVSKRLKR